MNATDIPTSAVPALADQTFVSRAPVAIPRPAPVTAVPANDRMGTMMQMANMLAAAKSAIPESYRNNPGAVALALGFAEARDLDILTVVGTVSFVSGKPVIDATLQRALAKRAGYDVRIPRASETAATVEVWERGAKLGEATYTIDQAKTAGLAVKDNWRKNPEDMLVARATTRAIRRFAPDAMTGVITQDEADELDPISVAAPIPEAAAPALPTAIATTESITSGTDDGAAPSDAANESPWGADVDALKADLKTFGVTQAEAIQAAQVADPTITGLTGILTSPAGAAAVIALGSA